MSQINVAKVLAILGNPKFLPQGLTLGAHHLNLGKARGLKFSQVEAVD